MTTSLETLCRQVEQESAGLPKGPWKEGQNQDDSFSIRTPYPSEEVVAKSPHENVATFIATARDFAPKAARALRIVEQILNDDTEYQDTLFVANLRAALSEFEQPKENA